MKTDGTIAMFRYWNALRGGREAPARLEIEPARIKSFLSNTFILEVGERHPARFRLAGTGVCAIFGCELRGQTLAQFWTKGERAALGGVEADVAGTGRPVCMMFSGSTLQDRSALFEMILLPLRAEDGGSRLLGSVEAIARPFWLGAHPVVTCRTQSLETIDPDTPRARVKAPPAAPEAPEPLDPTLRARKVRHLVVMDGGLTQTQR